ncbi:Putative lipoprotein yceB precursor [Dickeya aquatica]|uniref:Lipoprotein yceB n=2 Tax=Pectobacteriaceae TaxID=1903410 RepID=A0A375ACA9_9GAMM|nr:Putative lipoprotein yceB precursor [Dickeya aquatica]
MAALLLFSILLLGGCGPLTQYSLSEQEINQYLQQHNDYQKTLGVQGVMDAKITLTHLSSQIGRTEPGKVTLSSDANVDLHSLLGSQQAALKLTLKAQPVFDKQNGAIYLKEMELVDYSVQPQALQTVLQTLIPYLRSSLTGYFDQKPAYVLSPEHSSKEALARKLAKGIDVKPGQLVIMLTD